MVEEDRYCLDVLAALSAVTAVLDQVSLQSIEDHTKDCVRQDIEGGGKADETI